MEHKYMECACSSPEHVIRMAVDKDDGYPFVVIETQMSPYLKWYKRIWLGIKYILGFKSINCHWAETLLSHCAVEDLCSICDEYFVARNKYLKLE